MRIVYVGTADFGTDCLSALAASGQVAAIITSPDRPAGRGLKVRPRPVKQIGLKAGVPVLQPEDINEKETVRRLADYNPDLLVVIGYGRKLSPAVLAVPAVNSINVHASLLPRYRGAAPIRRAIIAGEKQTGISIITVAEKIDAGDIIEQYPVDIAADDTYETVFNRLKECAVPCLQRAIQKLAAGTAVFTSQASGLVTYAPKISKCDSIINWARPAADINNQVRGLNPVPLAVTFFNGKSVKIYETALPETVLEAPRGEPGTVYAWNKQLFTACADRFLEIVRMKVEGKKQITGRDFLNGYPVVNGKTVFRGTPA